MVALLALFGMETTWYVRDGSIKRRVCDGNLVQRETLAVVCTVAENGGNLTLNVSVTRQIRNDMGGNERRQ